MPSEAMKVAIDASSPKALIAFAAVFGKTSSSTADAMGSQRVIDRTFVMPARFAGSLCGVSRSRGCGVSRCSASNAALEAPHRETAQPRNHETASCQHPNEHDHSQEKHQRVVPHVAGLEEAEQVTGSGHDVADQSEEAVDQGVDAAPEELGESFQRADDD